MVAPPIRRGGAAPVSLSQKPRARGYEKQRTNDSFSLQDKRVGIQRLSFVNWAERPLFMANFSGKIRPRTAMFKLRPFKTTVTGSVLKNRRKSFKKVRNSPRLTTNGATDPKYHHAQILFCDPHDSLLSAVSRYPRKRREPRDSSPSNRHQ